MVSEAVDPSLGKLELKTTASGEWDKKFQVYFGTSMRVNVAPSGASDTSDGSLLGAGQVWGFTTTGAYGFTLLASGFTWEADTLGSFPEWTGADSGVSHRGPVVLRLASCGSLSARTDNARAERWNDCGRRFAPEPAMLAAGCSSAPARRPRDLAGGPKPTRELL